jgi:glycosyltransferase involved in cell wall biosynthesis
MDTVTTSDGFCPDQDFLKTRVAFRRSVADWCLRQARRCIKHGQIEGALRWNHLAAGTLSSGCNPLVSEALEQNLLEIASYLPRFPWCPAQNRKTPRRWLHVIDHALPYGGHTAMARRWIANDPGNNVHSVALPAQDGPVPDELARAVHKSGGEILLPALNGSLLSRAIWLRELAYARADCVVLHIYNDNVIAPVAFGVDGGPPVVFVNHSGHLFWAGAAISDVAINGRGSESELSWIRDFRGISNVATLPIPIPPPQGHGSDQVFTAEFRVQARRKLNLPSDAIVLLSVGREEKYKPVQGLDFFETVHSILSSCPQARMLVVGPSEKDHHKRLNAKLNGRLTVAGLQFDLRAYYAAADIYMEGFPFGSTTALLEAGVHGLPCVLAPADCPPPFGTDGVALDNELQRPANVEEYAKRVKELIANPEERYRCGRSLARSVSAHHCGTGWTRYLSDLCGALPESHTNHPVPQPPSPPEEFDLYWTGCFDLQGDPLDRTFRRALFWGLTPRLDFALYRACHAARQVRRGQGRLRSSVPVLLSALFPLCPAAARGPLYHSLKKLKAWLRSLRRWKGTIDRGSVESVAAV